MTSLNNNWNWIQIFERVLWRNVRFQYFHFETFAFYKQNLTHGILWAIKNEVSMQIKSNISKKAVSIFVCRGEAVHPVPTRQKFHGYYFHAYCTQMKRFFEELMLFVVDYTRLNTPLHNTLHCVCRLMQALFIRVSRWKYENFSNVDKIDIKGFPSKKSPAPAEFDLAICSIWVQHLAFQTLLKSYRPLK